jgi:amidohydrolase
MVASPVRPQNAHMNQTKPLDRHARARPILIAVSLAMIANGCSSHAAHSVAPDPSAAVVADAARAITSLAAAAAPRLIELRRDLHRHPELAGQEIRTSALVAEHLEALGLEVLRNVGGHGVVGVLRGRRPGGVVAYRADMDAFRGDEPARPYASTVPGVQHVCGHDVHVAVGIGIATVLSELRDELPGTVVFVFQPAEENLQGAAAMLRDGALANPRPDAIFAIHAWPLPVGTIGYAPGEGIAGMDGWTIEVAGDGKLAASIVEGFGTVALPTRPEDWFELERTLRRAGGFERAVFVGSSTKRLANGRAKVEATVKAVRDEQYTELRVALKERLDQAIGADKYTLAFAGSPFPAMRSDVREAERGARTLASVLGAERVERYRATLPFAGEDFSLFLRERPGAMFFLGVANLEKGIVGMPHQPDFDVDEAAIEVGTRAMANVIWQRLAAPR